MNGFCIAQEVYDKAIEEISHAVLNPLLPLYEFQEAISPISGRIDQGLYASVCELVENYKQKVEGKETTHPPTHPPNRM